MTYLTADHSTVGTCVVVVETTILEELGVTLGWWKRFIELFMRQGRWVECLISGANIWNSWEHKASHR